MYCIIMAGGTGKRFWPRSRQIRAKQFLSIFQKKSLIQQTVSRFNPLMDHNHFFIVTNRDQRDILEKQVDKIPKDHFLYEPIGKNTAPCIGLAALEISRIDPEGVMVISPADHQVKQLAKFYAAINAAVKVAREKSGLVAIGIEPVRPATGYGYIQTDEAMGVHDGVEIYKVKTFAEKPNLETAKRFLESGDFLWNSGLFVMRADAYLNAVEEFLPELHDGLMEVRETMGTDQYEPTLQRVYQQIKSISVDYGVMEKASNVYTVKGQFKWNDLGSWEQVYKSSPKDENNNAINGDVCVVDTENSYIHSSSGVVGVIGLNNVIVVQEKDAVLVCPMDRAEDVKLLVEKMKRQKLEKYL